jgi:hypothetical protein
VVGRIEPGDEVKGSRVVARFYGWIFEFNMVLDIEIWAVLRCGSRLSESPMPLLNGKIGWFATWWEFNERGGIGLLGELLRNGWTNH